MSLGGHRLNVRVDALQTERLLTDKHRSWWSIDLQVRAHMPDGGRFDIRALALGQISVGIFDRYGTITR
jgi:hypothetical protein